MEKIARIFTGGFMTEGGLFKSRAAIE